MFERFTDRARRVVVLAQEEARMLNHNHIGTEHLLLGLINEGEGVAAQVLTGMGIGLVTVRQETEQIIGKGEDAPTSRIPFTARAKKVMELSLREALQLGHNYIGTEHILLGLIREGDGVAAQVLRKLGADLNGVRQAVMQLLAGRGPTAEKGGKEREEEEEGWSGPRCPKCGAEISVYAVFRSITIPDEEQSATRRVVFVFCRACSNFLGLLPE